MTNTTDFEQIFLSDDRLLKTVLTPYKEDCRYLKSALIKYNPFDLMNQKDNKYKSLLIAEGKFSIPESCYIRDTGHFNAVEFNICYNQLAYYLLAECVQHRLLDNLTTWDIPIYSRRQLTDILIVKFSSSFQKPICPNRFDGRIEVKKILKREKLLFIKTICGFSDSFNGSATGNVLFVILDPEK